MSTTQQVETLWKEHREKLFRFVASRVNDPATAEDIVHDILVRAYRGRDTLRDGQKLEPWLYRITRNAVIDHYRARRPTSPLPADLPEVDSEEGQDARAQLSQCIQPFVRALQETAAELGLSLSGAKSRIQRAKRMLADMMLECCRVEFDSMGAIMSYQSRGCGTDDEAGGGCGRC
jgi:RNA polymerase sigma-70 factor, ECF subfamily